MYDDYLRLSAEYTYTAEYGPYAIPQVVSTTVISGSELSPVTTINGNSGRATGSTVTFSGGSTGLAFDASGNTIALSGTLVVGSGGTGGTTPAAARANLLAAESGTNADITMLNALAGATGWAAATGTATKTTFDTATVTLPELAERVKALIDTLLGWGGVRT
jgi:hypothetical protein